MQFPHCDQRVLHAPGECQYCDLHPEWQRLRESWGIAFTGHIPGGWRTLRFEHRISGEPGRIPGTRVHQYEVEVPADQWNAPLPCPADFSRPPGAKNDHRRWAGNVATTQEPVNETFASQALYGRRFQDRYTVPAGVNVQDEIRDILQKSRRRPGFLARLRRNGAKRWYRLKRLR